MEYIVGNFFYRAPSHFFSAPVKMLAKKTFRQVTNDFLRLASALRLSLPRRRHFNFTDNDIIVNVIFIFRSFSSSSSVRAASAPLIDFPSFIIIARQFETDGPKVLNLNQFTMSSSAKCANRTLRRSRASFDEFARKSKRKAITLFPCWRQ